SGGPEPKGVLREGTVTIKSGEPLATYELAPGQLARFKSHDNKIAIQEVNTALYTSWREDKLLFAHTPMQKVADRIEDTFGLEVVIAPFLQGETLSGSIKSTNLKVLKEALEEILKTYINQTDERLLIGVDN